jgi:hypothetical protein
MRPAFAMINPVPLIEGICFLRNFVAAIIKALYQYLLLMELFVVDTWQPARHGWMGRFESQL